MIVSHQSHKAKLRAAGGSISIALSKTAPNSRNQNINQFWTGPLKSKQISHHGKKISSLINYIFSIALPAVQVTVPTFSQADQRKGFNSARALFMTAVINHRVWQQK